MAILATSFDEFLSRPNLSIVLNTEGLYFLENKPEFRHIVRNADWIYVDGVGLKIALRFAGLKDVRRLHGPDLFHKTLHLDSDRKQLIIGGSKESHDLLIQKYSNLSNNEKIAFYSEIVEKNNLDDLFDKMRQFKPDVVYVCLGIIKQEYIGDILRKNFPQCCIIGLGAAIDYESGNVKRSAPFFQKIGLEWLPRLIREPRMIPRTRRAIWGLISYSIAGLLGINKKEADLNNILTPEKAINGNKKFKQY